MIGAWLFHDHSRHIGESVNRGLFGGIVVLPQDAKQPAGFQLPPLVEEFVERCCREHPGDDDEPEPHVEPGHVHEHGPDHPGGHGEGHGAGHGGHGQGSRHNVRDPEHKAVLDFLEEWAQLDYAHRKPGHADTLHVPMFLHVMSRGRGTPAFNSGPFSPQRHHSQWSSAPRRRTPTTARSTSRCRGR
jgi:hypothetical protein